MIPLPVVLAERVTTRQDGRVVLFVTCPFCNATHVHHIARGEDPASYYTTPSTRNADCGRGRYEVTLQANPQKREAP